MHIWLCIVVVVASVICSVSATRALDRIKRDLYVSAYQSRSDDELTALAMQHFRDSQSWQSCRWQRKQAIEWLSRGFDLNGDGEFDLNECVRARHYYLSDRERLRVPTCERLFSYCGNGVYKCSVGGTGSCTFYLSLHDFEEYRYTCVASCDAITALWYYVVSRMPTVRAYDYYQPPDETVNTTILYSY